MKVANTDAPSAKAIPALCFNNAIASGSYWYAIACEYIGSFMNPSSAKTSPSAESTTVAMVTANRKGKRISF